MHFTAEEIAAFFRNIETQEFTGQFGPDWAIRSIAYKQGYEHGKTGCPAPQKKIE
ncbi:MAG: hypothetical protein WA673_01875 [Candidatus Acidiferrales bacterium]